jgi:hypothetical protein
MVPVPKRDCENPRLPDLFIIPHTHWDREWYEPFQGFRRRLVKVVDDLLDLLDRDPEFKAFMLDGQSIVIEDYLEIRPEMEARLRRAVESGRVLVGPWYVLPDEFLVSGESYIRNLERGMAVAGKFGQPMRIGYLPDPVRAHSVDAGHPQGVRPRRGLLVPGSGGGDHDPGVCVEERRERRGLHLHALQLRQCAEPPS